MNNLKSALPMLLLLAYFPSNAAAVVISPPATPLFGDIMQAETIYSKTYTTTGANSIVYGNVQAGDVSTIGANAKVFGSLVSTGAANAGGASSQVTGNIYSGGVLTTGDGSVTGGDIRASGAATIGANAHVLGNMVSVGVATTGDASKVDGLIASGGAASIGANGIVTGSVGAVGVISLGANSNVGGTLTLPASPFVATEYTAELDAAATATATLVRNAQTALKSLGFGTVLSATMPSSMTLTAGVYSAASFSTTADTTLTLDGQFLPDQSWIFNIADILAIGAGSKIVMINVGVGSAVIWNTGGYASTGDGSVFLGTLLAQTYISIGANAHTAGVDKTCGGLFSATSYVSTGDSAVVGGVGCHGIGSVFNIGKDGKPYRPTVDAPPPTDPSVPEPATWAMMIGGLFLTGWRMRRARRLPVTMA